MSYIQETTGGIRYVFGCDPYGTPAAEGGQLFIVTEQGIVGRTKLNKSELEEKGKKENEGKVSYDEIDWDFIDEMSKRMDANTKYPPLNYQKGMDVKELAKAAIRHARKILQPIEGDEETTEDHALAIGSNAMMMFYQVKNKKS